MLDAGQKLAIETDLEMAEDVLGDFEDQSRLHPEDAESIEEIIPNLERVQMLATGNDSLLKTRMSKILNKFANIDGRRISSTGQQKELKNVLWAKEIIETAREEI